MRVALCIAGLPRFFRRGYENYARTLLADRDVDVFLHCWFDAHTVGQRYAVSSGHDGGTVEPDVEAALAELYKPKRWLVQKQVMFDTEGFHVDGNYTNPHLFANFSWPYALRQAGRLCWDWEMEHGFTYDLVIATRYDLMFTERLALEELDPGVMYTLDSGIGLSFALCDMFFVSGHQNMKIMLGLYEQMFKYRREKDQFNTERNSFDFMKEHDIPMELLPIRQNCNFHLIGRGAMADAR